LYAKEYKNWISHENAVPHIIKTIESFKEYWADTIALVNQTDVPALQHGYRMTTMDNDMSVALYGDSLANFGAAFAATQETMKSQANSLVAMHNQLSNIQLCMNVSQQPPSSGYAPAQQQCTFTNHNSAMVAVRATPWFPTTTNHELRQYGWWSTAEHLSSQSLQTMGELELLSLPRWQC
jgi:hypothetical protein